MHYSKAWRQLPFDEKKVISERRLVLSGPGINCKLLGPARLKEEGNDLFKLGAFLQGPPLPGT